MNQIPVIIRKELILLSKSPIGLIYMCMFSTSSIGACIFLSHFFEKDQANLYGLFSFIPWLLALFTPAISMGSWVKEFEKGTIETLFTLPVNIQSLVTGKFLAAAITVTSGLAMTLPIVVTTIYLGDPDIGVICSSYLGSLLLGYTFLSFSCLVSSLADSQPSAFILGSSVNLLFLFLGWNWVGPFLQQFTATDWVERVQSLGLLNRYIDFTRGIIDLKDIFLFLTLGLLGLVLNTHILRKKMR